MPEIDWRNFTVLAMAGEQSHLLDRDAMARAVPIETCARHLYVAPRGDFSMVAAEIAANPKTNIWGEKRAYTFLTRLFAGLGRTKKIDKELPGQLWKSWVHYPKAATHPLSPHMTAIRQDGLLIFNGLLKAHLRRPTIQNAAIEMADLSAENKIVIIGGAEAITTDLICALGHKKKNMPEKTYFFHVDRALGEDILAGVKNLSGFRKIDTLPKLVPPDEIDDVLLSADGVFVCMPIADSSHQNASTALYQAFDDRLRRVWGQRKKENGEDSGKLIHLKGNPFMKGATSGPWLSFNAFPGFIPSEALTQRVWEKTALTNHVCDLAGQAVEHAASLRMQQRSFYDCCMDTETGMLALQMERKGPFLTVGPRGAAALPS